MIPTISQVCSLNASLAADIEDYAAGQCRSIEIWLGKLEGFLQDHSLDAFRQLVEQHEVCTPVASFQGGLLGWPDAKREHAWDHFQQRLSLCQQLDIGTLVVACDVVPPVTSDDVLRIHRLLKQAAQRAEEHEMRLAVEFQADAAFCNNLQTMATLVEEVGSSSLGICLDSFHFYTGPSKLRDLALLNEQNLFHVQLADLADVPREFAKNADRILPGEGDVPIAEILHVLHNINYRRCVSLEIMNPQIWQVPPLQFGEIAMTAMRRVLGQASHG